MSDLCVFGCLFQQKVPIETFHISSESTHNKQQAGTKSICTEERGKSQRLLQICVQVSIINGQVPPLPARKFGTEDLTWQLDEHVEPRVVYDSSPFLVPTMHDPRLHGCARWCVAQELVGMPGEGVAALESSTLGRLADCLVEKAIGVTFSLASECQDCRFSA